MILLSLSAYREKHTTAHTTEQYIQEMPLPVNDTSYCSSDTMLPNGNQVLFVERASGKKGQWCLYKA